MNITLLNNAFRTLIIVLASILLTSCAISPSYVSVMGADENNPDKVAYVADFGIPEQYRLNLYAVDGQKVFDAAWRVHYAIHPGTHILWVLAPAAIGGPWGPGVRVSPNRCFVFEIELIAGKTYYLKSFNKGKGARLEIGGSGASSVTGKLVDESKWTCYWDK